ncbi:DUF397 domain-containing protein [Streptomyces qinzhouensis]|uniref:DUF397 domain-containing protein n=1 Tax=Streptomyces qinzhouensis TaxID=2599401 RepID=A0A5B8IPF1_9ACTN|nr:DUF397 domain-containing protein [Streptomyces qinzhouensis]QDY79469.1 DUF397 domain-containing protein [Streptomyces qinzhouensis]
MNNAEPLTWFKSTYSGTEGGQCLEVAVSGTGAVHVRDSKAVTGPVLRMSPEAWAGFVGFASSEQSV